MSTLLVWSMDVLPTSGAMRPGAPMVSRDVVEVESGMDFEVPKLLIFTWMAPGLSAVRHMDML